METFSHPKFLVFLIVGILFGSLFAPLADRPFGWAVCFAVFAALLLLVARFFRRMEFAQSVAVYAAVVFLGALLFSFEKGNERCEVLGETVECEAVVASEPVERGKSYGCDVLVAGKERRYKLKAYFEKSPRAGRLRFGDRVRCRSRWQAPRDYYVSPHFNYKDYLLQHGYCGTTFVTDDGWQRVAPSMAGLGIQDRARLAALKLRKKLLAGFRASGMDEESFGLTAAIALGEKSFLKRQVREEYADAGVAHVLALSGMHLSIILGILSVVLFSWGRRARGAVELVFVWFFVFLSGMPVSIVRVAVMFSIYLVARMAGERTRPVNSLSLAAMAILVVSPKTLFEIGFQLSFVAVLFIFLLSDRLMRLFPRRLFGPLPLLKWVVSVACLSFAAQVGTLPIVLYNFGRLPVYSLLSNCFVCVLVIVVLALVALALLSGFSSVVVAALDKTVLFMNDSVAFVSSLPYATFSDVYINPAQVAVLYAMMLVVFLPLLKRKKYDYFFA